MRRLVMLLIAVPLTLAGCARADGQGPAGGVPGVPAPATSAPSQVQTVVFRQSGGLAGKGREVVILPSGGQARLSAADRQSLFGLVASPEFAKLAPSYQPANVCCDRFSYQIVVRYAGERVKTVTTIDDATRPAILTEVLALAKRA